MKKLLLSAALGLAALALSAAPSQAWTFGLIPWHCVPGGEKHCCCCSPCCCCCPYNAFSPPCCPVCVDLSQLGCNNAGYGCAGPGPSAGYLPDCGPAGPSTPAAPSSPPAKTGGAATSEAAPYVSPVPAPAYGYAPMPPTVLPMTGQPYYPAINGR
jgi:hypothetical protein